MSRFETKDCRWHVRDSASALLPPVTVGIVTERGNVMLHDHFTAGEARELALGLLAAAERAESGGGS